MSSQEVWQNAFFIYFFKKYVLPIVMFGDL